MTKRSDRPKDDPSSAPESGTDRDETTGNQPAARGERPERARQKKTAGGQSTDQEQAKDDPSIAGEER